jgi:hypothetical protein
MKMDETLYSVQEKVQNFAVIYLVDITKVPDFNKVSCHPTCLLACMGASEERERSSRGGLPSFSFRCTRVSRSYSEKRMDYSGN